jgi:hypothetical protein
MSYTSWLHKSSGNSVQSEQFLNTKFLIYGMHLLMMACAVILCDVM